MTFKAVLFFILILNGLQPVIEKGFDKLFSYRIVQHITMGLFLTFVALTAVLMACAVFIYLTKYPALTIILMGAALIIQYRNHLPKPKETK